MVTKIINFINAILGNHASLLLFETIAILVKSYLLWNLISIGLRSILSKKIKFTWIFLIMVLVSGIIEDASWLMKLTDIIFFPMYSFSIFGNFKAYFIHFAWVFAILHYQALAFFIECLIEKGFNFNLRRSVFLLASVIYSFIFIYSFVTDQTNTSFQSNLIANLEIYLFVLITPSLIFSLSKLKNAEVPKILKKQLIILILGLICPRVLSDFFQISRFFIVTNFPINYIAFVGLSTILITSAVFYCTRKVMNLRFLNFTKHVQTSSSKKMNFINDFKDLLEQLSFATSIQELTHITKNFFKDTFQIPTGRTILYIRKPDTDEMVKDHHHHHINIHSSEAISEIYKTKIDLIENFIKKYENSASIQEFIKQSKVIIYDEVEFTNFYEEDEKGKIVLNFLNQTNTDIFIPIFKKQSIIAYILIERDVLRKQIYTDFERDEMVAFTSYLGNVINLLQTRNLESLIQQEKEIKEELFLKHQEVNQYKESIRSFIKKSHPRKIAILFYKNRKFIYGNQDAKEIISININNQEGHSLTQDLKKVVKDVEDYKSPQTLYSKDTQGNKIIITGIPNLENNNVIITVYHPDISDIIKQQIDLLKDPSKWDYLLYLETTRSGHLINQLIPGSGESLFNFKINLLKAALGKKAILIEMPEEDLISTVEIIHHISLRENLHVLKLQAPSKNSDIAIKLFGINPMFGKIEGKPLLQKLDSTGTLFIENIHFLDLETQEYLVEFIRYGFFRLYKSEQKIISDVRIICSTNQNLKYLISEGKFSHLLYEEIKKTSISFPSLLTLSDDELNNLAQGYSDQTIQNNEFKNLLELSEKDKINILNKRPVSLQEFRAKVQQILTEKSKKNNIFQETQFDPAYNISDPKLIEAARLGKHALKDPQILALLWSKFKNQNKIATFLGVNRSSVHRRCKEYNIE